MRAVLKIQNPDEVTIDVTFTMTVEQARKLIAVQPQGWPSWQFASLLRQVVEKAIARVDVEQEADTP